MGGVYLHTYVCNAFADLSVMHFVPCVTTLASAFCLQNSAKGKDQSNDEELDNMMTVSTHPAPGAALADDQVVEEGFLEQVAQ